MTAFAFDTWFATYRRAVDGKLDLILQAAASEPDCPRELGAAMRYTLMGGGKRLRPLLVLAAARACGKPEELGLGAGCALELIHAYSLIHDDLPAMDDDDMRRGLPACHRAFGEGMAILAGDALLTHAFWVLADEISADLLPRAVTIVSMAAGPRGMVGGQADDIRPGEGRPTIAGVEFIHARKTGALFRAALQLGGLLAGAGPSERDALDDGGKALGLAFQIADDLLAFAGDSKSLGRPADSDEKNLRSTYPGAAGASAAGQRARELLAQANAALRIFGPRKDALSGIAGMVEKRITN